MDRFLLFCDRWYGALILTLVVGLALMVAVLWWWG
jgi:hypothetical protein